MKVIGPDIYTTGKIAKLCSVSIRTVARWIETENLKAFRLPGESTEYRVTKTDFLSFLKDNGMPFEHIEGEKELEILLLDENNDYEKAIKSGLASFEGKIKLTTMPDLVSGAIQVGSLKPQLMVFNIAAFKDADVLRMVEVIRSAEQLKEMNLIAIVDQDTAEKFVTKLEKLNVFPIVKKSDTGKVLSGKVKALFV